MQAAKTFPAPDAAAAIAAHRAVILAMLQHLTDFAEDHFGLHPDTLTWANVGDAARLSEALTQLVCDSGLDEASVLEGLGDDLAAT